MVIGRPDIPVPRWTYAWCDDVGYELVRRPADPGSALDLGPEGDEWSRLAIDVAALSAAGNAVLISRGTWRDQVSMRVVAAIHDLPDDDTVLVDAAASAGRLGSSLQLVHGVPVSFAERSVGLDAAVARGLSVLEDGLAFLTAHGAGANTSTRLLRVRPHELVNELLEADLLVVGGARLGPAGRLGLVALSAMQHAPCPVLLTPRMPLF